ncbi:MAG: S9 family peptidase [Candidatus Omnitrophica bacterium]|nr:S9 family peptidase [Candidatus Omnitrophota bacterium]
MRRILPVIAALGVLLGAVFLIWSLSRGNLPPLIPREVLFGSPENAAPQISPDGSRIAYLAPYEGVLNIWLFDRSTKEKTALTRDRGRGISIYQWAPDGKTILFLQDRDGDENWHLYQKPLSDEPPKDLTPFEGVQAGIVGSDKHFPGQLLIALNKEDRTKHDVYRLDLRTDAIELAAENTGQIAGWIVDPRGMKVRAAIATRPEGGNDVLVRDGEEDAWRKVLSWSFEDSMTSSVLGFTPDGRGLYLVDSRERDTTALKEWDLAAGTEKVLLSDPHYDIGGVIINPDDYAVEMAQIYREKSNWIPLRPAVRGDLEFLSNAKFGDFSITSRSHDDRYWIVRYENDVTAVNYYIYDRKEKTKEFLFAHQPRLSEYRLSVVHPFEFRARDGLKISGYKTLPKQGKAPFPTVLLVHGGPWSRRGWGYDPIAQWLADRGYASLWINFRGSTGFGKAFVNAGNREWGGKMQDDLADGVQWAVRQGIADPERVGIMGGSYGGYAVLAAAVFTPDLFRCGIDLFGPSDLVTFLNAIPPYWSVEKSNIFRSLGDPATEAPFLRERSPLHHVDKVRMPLLIAQGANDARVPQSESERVVEALRGKGIPCEYLVFPDEGHGFVKPENRLKFYRTAEAFLARHLGGRSEP